MSFWKVYYKTLRELSLRDRVIVLLYSYYTLPAGYYVYLKNRKNNLQNKVKV